MRWLVGLFRPFRRAPPPARSDEEARRTANRLQAEQALNAEALARLIAEAELRGLRREGGVGRGASER